MYLDSFDLTVIVFTQFHDTYEPDCINLWKNEHYGTILNENRQTGLTKLIREESGFEWQSMVVFACEVSRGHICFALRRFRTNVCSVVMPQLLLTLGCSHYM